MLVRSNDDDVCAKVRGLAATKDAAVTRGVDGTAAAQEEIQTFLLDALYAVSSQRTRAYFIRQHFTLHLCGEMQKRFNEQI